LQAQRLPDDLVGVPDAEYASLDGLAPGSAEAQERQRQAAQQLGWPLEVTTRKTGIVFRLIPAGSFTMGSPKAEQDAMVAVSADRAGAERAGKRPEHEWVRLETEHQVTLSRPFYCGKYEVTQEQWELVMGNNPSHFKNAGKNAPVESVSWEDCRAFVKGLCRMEGVPEGTYRLLTEAEWEYACRAGTRTALYGGEIDILGVNNVPAVDPIGWYTGNSGVDYEGAYDSGSWPQKQYDHRRAGTHPAGGKRPNGFGLYDMIGNAWEWCQDGFGEYPTGAVTDPVGPPPVPACMLRGGCWCGDARDCRSACRGRFTPEDRESDFGLRLARIK